MAAPVGDGPHDVQAGSPITSLQHNVPFKYIEYRVYGDLILYTQRHILST